MLALTAGVDWFGILAVGVALVAATLLLVASLRMPSGWLRDRSRGRTALTPSLAAPEIIATMADALFVCGRDGRINFANRAASVLLGYSEEEFAGRRIDDFLASDRDLSSKLHRGSFRNAEYVFLSRSAARVDLTLSIAPILQRGEPAGAVIIGRDMRDRKRAEREVLQAVTLLQSTLDSTADGILVVGEEGRIVSYNQRFVDMWRIPRNVLEGSEDRRLIQHLVSQVADAADLRETFDSLESQADPEKSDALELLDGRRFERYSIGRRLAGSGHIRVWSFRDVTARVAAEKALRESEIRYRLLFEQNAAGVCVSRLDGVIVDCNTTFSALVGQQRSEVLGKRLHELYAAPSEADEIVMLLRSVGTLNSVELEMRRANGNPLWVIENLVLVGDADTGVVHATVVDISDRKRTEEQIEFHAYHDVLTGLPNRRLFTDRLRHSISRARRSARPIAVMFIDIDHFKAINDRLGHTAGDELLLEMAQRLRDCVRDDDTVARLGGDEFCIILSELREPEDAVVVAEKILANVQNPLTIGGLPISATASIGVSIFPADGNDSESLLRNADSAMYRAKEAGRNTVRLCTDEMKMRAVERLSVESRLRIALRDDQLLVHYQPQISLTTGRLIGVEALVRWNDPERGLVEPGAFIGVAEESRLIIPLGEWVLRTACRQMRDWQDHGVGPIRLAVNLSSRQFQRHDLLTTVSSALAESGLDPSTLELEITETTAMRHPEATVGTLSALRALGVGVAIDDFGTGYSSISHLKRFALTGVKIDRAFVCDLASARDGAVVSAVIGLARSLDLRVGAEGVETEEQLTLLRDKHCDEVQGYFLARPAGVDEMTRLLLDEGKFGAGSKYVV